MSQTTSPSGLCHTLSALAAETWAVMSYGLARYDQREPDERTFTDHHFLHLERHHAPSVRTWLIDGSDEALTGADVEWWVGDGRTYLRLLVQAKRLNRRARYAEVGRDIGQTDVRQVDRLVEICERGLPAVPRGMDYVGLVPTYLFYNGSLTEVTAELDLCRNAEVSFDQRGCTVAHAHAVQSALGEARPGGRRFLSYEEIAPSAVPWRCLLCCLRHRGTAAERVRSALIDSMRIDGAETVDDPGPGREPSMRLWEVDELPFDPAEAPSDVAALLERAGSGWAPGGHLLAITTASDEDGPVGDTAMEPGLP